jgi:hypothetical protein
MALGAHAHRIVSLNLAWNDFTADAVETLVKGLLGMHGACLIPNKLLCLNIPGVLSVYAHSSLFLSLSLGAVPAFEAESYDPASLRPSRTCALASLNLKGNQIGDDGVEWLAFLLRGGAAQAAPAPYLKQLGLCQCAVEAKGAGYLKPFVSNGPLTSLDLRDNDVANGTTTLALAAAAARLPDFGGQNLAAAAATLESAVVAAAASRGVAPTQPVVLVAGQDAMAHGALALLEVLRRFVPPAKAQLAAAEDGTSTSAAPVPNRIFASSGSSTNATATAGAVVPVIVDLRGSRMCGFYAEHTWAVDALVAILEAQQAAHTSAVDAAALGTSSGYASAASPAKGAQMATGADNLPAAGASTAEVAVEITVEGVSGGGSEALSAAGRVRVVVQTVELDEGCGLVPNQLQALFDACDTTTVNVDGKAYAPPRGLCSVQ